jgi:hypothetical protein
MTDARGKQLMFVQNQRKPSFSYLSNTSPRQVVFFSSFKSSTSRRGFRMLYLVLNDTLSNGKEKLISFMLNACTFLKSKRYKDYPDTLFAFV